MNINFKKFNNKDVQYLLVMILIFFCSIIITIIWSMGYVVWWLFSKLKLYILKKNDFVS